MSLLGNRDNDFEKKLKKQLGDTELKPSESLWDRIDQEVNRPEFEHKVEGKIGKYEVKPKPETWTYIEEQLPPEPSRWKRAGKVWYGIAFLLFFGGAFAGYHLSTLPEQDIANVPVITIEPSNTGSGEVKEIVGGTDRQTEEISDESVIAKGETPAMTDERATPATPGSDAPSLNTQNDRTDNAAVATASTPKQSISGQVQQAVAVTERNTYKKQDVVSKPALSQAGSKNKGPDHYRPTANPGKTAAAYNRSTSRTAAAKAGGNRPVATGSSWSYRKSSPLGDVSGVAPEKTIAARETGKNNAEETGNTVQQGSTLVADPTSGNNNNAGLTTGQADNGVTTAPERNTNEAPAAVAEKTTEPVAPAIASSETQQEDTTKVADKPGDTGKPMLPLSDSVARMFPADFNQIETQAPTRLSISIMAGLHQSNMKLVAPDHRKKMEENVALRRQTETPKIDFTGGFLLDYEASPRVLISSGILFTGFSMGMRYNVSPASKEASPQPGATYTNVADSIERGSGMNNRIHYSWNEIPLFVTLRVNKPSQRLGIEVKTGVSYAMLNAVDAAMVGQENIGVLLLKNKESFPHMKNSFFVHLYAGVSYQINESVAIQLMPYFRYSLSNMIDNENWVKQYPWMVGVNFGLRKSF